MGFRVCIPHSILCYDKVTPKLTQRQSSGIWLFNEGNGKIVEDLSGNGNDGELKEGTKWEDGQFGTSRYLRWKG